MFFTTTEEWIGLIIALPFCILAGYINAKHYEIRDEYE